MASRMIPLTALSSFLSKLLHDAFRSSSTSQWKSSNSYVTQSKYQRFSSLIHKKNDLSKQTLVFDLEGVLLKSFRLFPYFMLVALEASGLFRAFILLLLYPFISLLNKESRLNIMVFLCFFGIRKDKFRIGTSVFPKWLYEDTASESYDIVMSCGRKIGVCCLPRVMVEGFLTDYIGVDAVVGKELKVLWGFYVGLMEDNKKASEVVSELLVDEQKLGASPIGMACFNKSLDHQLFKHCKEVYLVAKSEKRKWQILPKEKRSKPLYFHDGRIAFRPTPLNTLVMFMWLPIGISLFFIRVSGGTLLPFKLSHVVLSFSGNKITYTKPENSTPSINNDKQAGLLYVCNHRTLLDPVAISLALCKPVAAVTYSLSRVNELISPIKTVRLTRDREIDGKMMAKMLSQGDLVVCPEGTTCREPYLLRFSPLFAELSDDIVPVAVEVEISMFYGSTAGGMKCLDPIFHFANPHPSYSIKFLEKLDSSQTCNAGKKSKFEVANYVQQEIGKAVGYECTSFTRKDKYKILAGNDGLV
ncbi:hypothetical protein ACFE04_016106 [Oxalis oulophora]